jgi:hypothetical protein
MSIFPFLFRVPPNATLAIPINITHTNITSSLSLSLHNTLDVRVYMPTIGKLHKGKFVSERRRTEVGVFGLLVVDHSRRLD